MKRFFASIVVAIAIICGYLTPAYAGGSPITAKITNISSGSSQVSSPVPVPNPNTTTPAPQSGVTTPAPNQSTTTQPTKQTTPTQTPKPSETKLAKTGFDISFVALVAVLIFVFGSFLYLGSRKDD